MHEKKLFYIFIILMNAVLKTVIDFFTTGWL